ncbi:uncharacterized protein LOC106153931 [Lingula anatina]|uniref:Uncharacterized protein LOC106153931 n=1 Tax=Lingula anatina TaxID=7574 RepID=A0A1S3HC12_LINAN|nr:uncharacterized protein LOC106153931 [Lingula anatina]|eukprot:XP_013383535.1 uncharacterized protein LOC106153931 [Lingula anatina]
MVIYKVVRFGCREKSNISMLVRVLFRGPEILYGTHCWGALLTKTASRPLFQLSRSISSHPISRFPVPERSKLPEDIQEQMDEVEEKSGFLPNVFKALAYRPDEFRAFFSYYDAVMNREGSKLSKADKEMIIVATSAANNCLYCVVAHGALHRIYSKNPIQSDQVAVNWRCSDIDDRQKAILEFAIDVCQARPITEQHFEELANHGLSKEDAWDIGSIAALFALSNRMAHVTAMRPNDEFYLMGRVKKEKSK